MHPPNRELMRMCSGLVVHLTAFAQLHSMQLCDRAFMAQLPLWRIKQAIIARMHAS